MRGTTSPSLTRTETGSAKSSLTHSCQPGEAVHTHNDHRCSFWTQKRANPLTPTKLTKVRRRKTAQGGAGRPRHAGSERRDERNVYHHEKHETHESSNAEKPPPRIIMPPQHKVEQDVPSRWIGANDEKTFHSDLRTENERIVHQHESTKVRTWSPPPLRMIVARPRRWSGTSPSRGIREMSKRDGTSRSTRAGRSLCDPLFLPPVIRANHDHPLAVIVLHRRGEYAMILRSEFRHLFKTHQSGLQGTGAFRLKREDLAR
jgi:hypothetical protein